MRFAFYKKGSPRKDVRNTEFHLSFEEPKSNPKKFYLEKEENLPENIEFFLQQIDELFDSKESPFFVISEDELNKRTSSSEFNLNVQQATGDTETVYIDIPEEVDYVHWFYNESLIENEVQLNKAINRTNFPQFNYSRLVPLEISLGEQSVKLTYSTSKKSNEKRYFLFIDNLAKKAKTIFNEYDPRLFEINRDSDKIIESSFKKLGSSKTIALIIHGFMSKTEENFEELKNALLNSNKYDLILGYSYAPNQVCIQKNGKLLTGILKKHDLLNPNLDLDIYAHSQGGLVARSMIVHEISTRKKTSIRNYNTAGTPHEGTVFAKIGYRALTMPKIALLTTAVARFPDTQSILFFNKILFYYFYFKGNKGLIDMCPNSAFLKSTNKKPFNINGSIMLTGYCVGTTNSLIKRIFTNIVDRKVFSSNKLHDTVVPLKSSTYNFTSKSILHFNDSGWHSEYFNKAKKAKAIVDNN